MEETIITAEVLQGMDMDQGLLEILFEHRPDLVRYFGSEEGIAALTESLKGNPLLELRTKGGVAVEELPKEAFLDYAMKPRAVHFSLFTEEDWERLRGLGDRSTAFVEAWVEWAEAEAWTIFSKEYEVKALSSYTIGRWREFLRVWGELTEAARTEVLHASLDSAEEDDLLELKWQVEMAGAGWSGAAVEVPFVSNQRAAASDETAVPRGADGKAKEVC